MYRVDTMPTSSIVSTDVLTGSTDFLTCSIIDIEPFIGNTGAIEWDYTIKVRGIDPLGDLSGSFTGTLYSPQSTDGTTNYIDSYFIPIAEVNDSLRVTGRGEWSQNLAGVGKWTLYRKLPGSGHIESGSLNAATTVIATYTQGTDDGYWDPTVPWTAKFAMNTDVAKAGGGATGSLEYASVAVYF